MRLAELIVILELHQQGMTVSAIARRTGLHRSTVAKYIARGIEPPAYGPRSPRPTKLTPFERYLRGRIAAVPELTGSRLYREIRGLGYAGGYTALKDFLRQVRPRPAAGFEIRFETPAGRQEQVDFAHFRTVFTDEPGAERIVWLFSLVLGHSRMMWGRFVLHQDMQTLLRCHADAFAELGVRPCYPGVGQADRERQRRPVLLLTHPAAGPAWPLPAPAAPDRHSESPACGGVTRRSLRATSRLCRPACDGQTQRRNPWLRSSRAPNWYFQYQLQPLNCGIVRWRR